MTTKRPSSHPTKRLTVSLGTSEREELKRLSDITDRSLAWHVREAIRQYLLYKHKSKSTEAN